MTDKEKIEAAKTRLNAYNESIKKVERYERLLSYAQADVNHPRLTFNGNDCNGGGKSSNTSDGAATLVLRMLDIEEKYNTAIAEANSAAEKLSRYISKMPETDGKAYLIEIYLLLVPVKTVCYTSHKGIRQFYDALNNGLLDFYTVWKAKENKRK